jgi:hypothetical protein
VVSLVVVLAVFGPGLVERLRRSTDPVATSPQPNGPPVLVARDSGWSQPPREPVRNEPVVAPQAAPPPVRNPTPAPAPAPVVQRPTPPPPRPPAATTAPARLFVNSTPWGQLYIDGQLVGNTPQANLVVSAGAHRNRIAREGFQPWERAVQLAPAQELRITDIALQALAP